MRTFRLRSDKPALYEVGVADGVTVNFSGQQGFATVDGVVRAIAQPMEVIAVAVERRGTAPPQGKITASAILCTLEEADKRRGFRKRYPWLGWMRRTPPAAEITLQY